MNSYKIKYLSFLLLLVTGCQNFLEVNPKGVLSESQAEEPEQLESFVIAAYSHMPSLGFGDTHNPWIQSVRSDDAYKGGGGLNDQTPWYEMEIFTRVNPNVGNNDGPWYRGYVGISRANTALRLLNTVEEAEFAMKEQRIAEMKFLRGWIYLGMKLRWKYIPIIDENTPTDAAVVEQIPNRPDDMANDLPIWDWIIQNFEDAAAALPETQAERGRPTKYAAHALAAKALLFRAYEQNDRHQVININQETLNRALIHVDAVMAQDGAQFDLQPDFGDNFMIDFDNNTKESLWEIQYSIDDGTTDGRINRGNELNAPWWSPYFTCCDFNKVSHTMINAFKTDETGLPDFVNYNDTEMTGSQYEAYFQDHAFDPRLSHTAAIPGYPFKYDNDLLYEESGSRAPFQYGYFNSLKEQVHPDCDCIFRPFYVMNALNEKAIRYAEVLLWKAEILIQLDRFNEALPLINRVRTRAANSTPRLQKPDGSLWMDYRAETYQPGLNCNWTKDFAWEALIWENRLEFAMEGRRFFDLMRWGLLESVMNAFINKERTRFDWYNQGRFTAGRDEFLPIPQAQMNWSRGAYQQNPGY
ncbi:RagB/SusD family nutrient uptake outer membrane protein [Olivibacter sp. SDN3]|uniref:RagB/SusD family nutrient uptake outer membrane protein n=1 Tax=Olivibacter sp. SDN3 TaxID=2764720 RepID=UPI001650E70F|nr:RagB/SusD family nutrient uptake outer membrane protein [Olivibacter sp. SDN3]QNL50578.1 RagB/SusD family nutrient uptake outer membrane protein [Olivibacter sp. SDN3]